LARLFYFYVKQKCKNINLILLAIHVNFDTNLLDETTSDYESRLILSIIDGIARITGIVSLFAREVVRFSATLVRVALNLEQTMNAVAVLGSDDTVNEGDYAERTYLELIVPTRFVILRRVVDALRNIIDSFEKYFSE
jgi:F0F1-type ATP synthase alpha subunit